MDYAQNEQPGLRAVKYSALYIPDEDRPLYEALQKAARIKALQTGLTVGAALLLGVAVAALVFLVLDPFARFVTGRWVFGLFCGAGLLLLPVVIPGVMARRFPPPDTAALWLERANANLPLRNRLVNAWQLCMRYGRDPRYDLLVERLRQESARDLGRLRYGPVFDAGRLKRLGWGMLAAAIFCGLYAAVSPDYFFNSFARLLHPGRALAPIIRTQIFPGQDPVVYACKDEPFKFSAKLSGRIPRVAYLRYWFTDRSWLFASRRVLLQYDSTANAYTFRLDSVPADLRYYFEAGDNTSPLQEVRAVDRPKITSVRYVYHYPRFTRQGDRTEEGARRDITGVLGTRADVFIGFNKPVKECSLLFGRKTPQPLVNEGTEWKGSVKIFENQGFQFVYSDAYGFSGREDDEFHVKVQADNPPEVEVAARKPGIQVLREDRMLLDVSARDDFGLADVTVSVLESGSSQEKVLEQWADPLRPKSLIRTASLDIAQDIGPDTLSFKVVVTAHDDNDLEGRHETRRELGPFQVLTAFELRMQAVHAVAAAGQKLHEVLLNLYLARQCMGGATELLPGVLGRMLPLFSDAARDWKSALETLQALKAPVAENRSLLEGYQEIVTRDVARLWGSGPDARPSARDVTALTERLQTLGEQMRQSLPGLLRSVYGEEIAGIGDMERRIETLCLGKEGDEAARSGQAAPLVARVEDRLSKMAQTLAAFKDDGSPVVAPLAREIGLLREALMKSSVMEAIAMQKKACADKKPAMAASNAQEVEKLAAFLAAGSWREAASGGAGALSQDKMLQQLTDLVHILDALILQDDLSTTEVAKIPSRPDPAVRLDGQLLALREFAIVQQGVARLFDLKSRFPTYTFLGYDQLKNGRDRLAGLPDSYDRGAWPDTQRIKRESGDLLHQARDFLMRTIASLRGTPAQESARDEAKRIVVSILAPEPLARVLGTDSVPVRMKIESPDGVSRILFKYRSGDEKDYHEVLAGEPKTIATQVPYDYRFPLNLLGLDPGAKLTYFVEVYDQGVVKQRKGVSEERQIEVVSSLTPAEKKQAKQDVMLLRRLFDLTLSKQLAVNEDLSALSARIRKDGKVYYNDIEKIRQIEDKQQLIEKTLTSLTRGIEDISVSNQMSLTPVIKDLDRILSEDMTHLKTEYTLLREKIRTQVMDRQS